MTIHEPLTVATDYALSAGTATFAVLAWRRGARLWALMLFFTAAGSFLGGTYHGTANELWWKPTVYAIGLASLFLLLGATRNRTLRAFAILQFVVYGTWMITHDSFLFVIIDYGVALIVLSWIQIYAYSRNHDVSARWIIGGVVVSVVAVAVQQAPIRWNNDIYHVIQLFAMWLLYRGGMAIEETRETAPEPAQTSPVPLGSVRSTIRPT